jgi:hypothetical protein
MSRMQSILLRIAKALGCLFVAVAVFAGWLYWRDSPPSDLPQGEVITAEEEELTPAIIAAAVRLSAGSRDQVLANDPNWKGAGSAGEGFRKDTFRRDVHAKTHGCLQSTFEIAEDIPDELRHGLFAGTGKHPAWIRFSNGTSLPQPDEAKDARGMAIKVMQVPGRKLLPGEEDDTTQDFLLINSPTFFIPTIREYAEFGDALAEGRQVAYFFGGGSLNPLTWKLRQLRLALATLKKAPDSLLRERYYSLSAYALGPDRFVKYSARPCGRALPTDQALNGPDFLRQRLSKEIANGDACFEFLVQKQVDGVNMPVENATVEWPESKSAFVKVATLKIPRQNANTAERNRYCENLSFNPWHALPEHRPAGVMNRVRRSLYLEISRFRRCKNERSYLGEPRSTAAEPWALEFDCKPCEPAEPNAPPRTAAPQSGGCAWNSQPLQ